jgi:Transposase DDE domain
MDAILDTVPGVLQTLFGATADRLARQTGFVQRVRQVKPSTFARTLSLFLLREPHASLTQLAQEVAVSASAVSQRLNDPSASAFLLALLHAALTELAVTSAPRVSIPLLRRFNGVYLVDGTTLSLPATLAERFAGYGGGTHPGDPSAAAAVKVLLRWRLDTSRSTDLLFDAATTPDVYLLHRLPGLPVGALHIADLGFYEAESLQELTANGVYWLSRLPTVICVGVDRVRLQELAPWLDDLGRHSDRWEGELWIGKVTTVRARVCVQRCPPEIAARRRRALRERASRKGRPVSQRQLTLCDWWVLATNVPAEMLSATEAAELYRARWQIELVFKRWKSLGHLEVGRSFAAERALATLYGLLLGLLVVDWLTLQRGGALGDRSLWQGWQIIRRRIDRIDLALHGLLPWDFVLSEVVAALDHRSKQPYRKKYPSTRQRLYRSTLRA